MPFSIHCAGNDHFLYAEGYVSTIGDVFEIQSAMDRIGGGVTAPVQTIAENARDAALPNALQAGMAAQDAMIAQGVLNTDLTMALIRMPSLQINVAARNPGWVLTEAAFASVMLYQGDSDCIHHFMRNIGPALVQTGLNGGAVLEQIAHAVRNFDASGCGALSGPHAPADFLLLIQLTVV